MPLSTSFSSHLREVADPIREARHAHPFVQGIGDGALDVEKLGVWLRQDNLYLIDYARPFAAGVLKAPDAPTMTTMAQMVHEILHTEMDLHRSYAAEFGITISDLEWEMKAPACQGYTDYLLRTATIGDFAELLAVLLPCIWGYAEVGQRLATRGMPADYRYARWIGMSASEEFAKLGSWCRDMLDRVAEGQPADALKRLEAACVTSSRYGLAFWDMAWSGEQWTV